MVLYKWAKVCPDKKRKAKGDKTMLSIKKAAERAFNRANLIGEGVDLDGILFSYKVLRNLCYEDPDKYEEIYQQIRTRLFGR